MIKRIAPFVALVTCYNSDETVNYDSIKKQVRKQIAAGNNIFCSGTNADFSALSFEERVKIVETVLNETAGKVLVFANAGYPSTFETLRLAKELENCGVDAIAAITPYFIKCTQEGMYQHFIRLSDSLKVPVYLYDIPGLTHNPIDTDTVRRLAKHENFRGIKDTSGNIENMKSYCQIRETEKQNFEIFTGPDNLILKGFQLGATGCVSGLANVLPEWVNSIYRYFTAGDSANAEKIQSSLSSFRESLYSFGYAPAMVKRALYVMDSSVGNNRFPAAVPDECVDTGIQKLLKKYEITV